MCAPLSVTTGGATGGCVGICQVLPTIIGSVALGGALLWNFRRPISKKLLKKEKALPKTS